MVDERRIHCGLAGVVMVSLIDQYVSGRRKLVDKGFQILPSGKRSRWIVWIANIHQCSPASDAFEHSVEIMGKLSIQWNGHYFGACRSSIVLYRFKRGRRL